MSRRLKEQSEEKSSTGPGSNGHAAVRLEMFGVSFHAGGRAVLSDISWRVKAGEHWAIVGANGSGKTTLLKLASGYLWPSEGELAVLGERFGEVDLRQLRRRIGWVSAAIAEMFQPGEPALRVVLSGAYASVGLWDVPAPDEPARAATLLEQMGCAALARDPWGQLSLGERQRVLIARALMARPELLILDEACAGLDLPGRESLLATIDELGQAEGGPSVVLVTHHIEEITPLFAHVLVLRGGRVLAAGPKPTVLTGAVLGEALGVEMEVDHRHGRFWPRVVRARPAGGAN